MSKTYQFEADVACRIPLTVSLPRAYGTSVQSIICVRQLDLVELNSPPACPAKPNVVRPDIFISNKMSFPSHGRAEPTGSHADIFVILVTDFL